MHHGTSVYWVNAERLGANGLCDWPCALRAHCEIPVEIPVVLSLSFLNLIWLNPCSVSSGFGKISQRKEEDWKRILECWIALTVLSDCQWLLDSECSCLATEDDRFFCMNLLEWLYCNLLLFFEYAEFASCVSPVIKQKFQSQMSLRSSFWAKLSLQQTIYSRPCIRSTCL